MSNGFESTQESGKSDKIAPSSEAVRDAIQGIQKSTEFDGATRLKSFLSYVVQENLAGRGSAIRAKTIAEDVYGILSNQGSDPLAVVRVDALRLRRRLDAYYTGSGCSDPVRIHIDTGGYAPRYEVVSTEHDAFETGRSDHKTSSSWTFIWIGFAGLACAAAIAVISTVLGIFSPSDPRQTSNTATETAVRDALFSASPAKLQARNLADDARRLMFPALDRQRLMAALALFERVIELDNGYYAGFAGAAQVKALLAVQTPFGLARDKLVSSATELAERAVDLAPDVAWPHSSLAMAVYSATDCREATAHSERALSLSPDDPYALNFDALISLFCGNFERALQVANANSAKNELSEHLVIRNVAASAEFHLGYFQKSVDRYSVAVQSGAPVGALTLSYLAAAYFELGQLNDARRAVDLLAEAWPDALIDKLLLSIFVDPKHAEGLLTSLQGAGWQPTSDH